MRRTIFATLSLSATLVLTGCAGGNATTTTTSATSTTSASPTPSEATVRIDGKDWTCAQITASGPDECGPFTQQAFETYKENLDTYVRSGQLGIFNNDSSGFSYEDTAFAGLVACAIMLKKGNVDDYIDAMLAEEPFKTRLNERTPYLPTWFAAKKYLCTDLEQISNGRQSTGDKVAP